MQSNSSHLDTDKPKTGREKMKNIQVSIICGVIAIVAISCSLGVASDIFATSTFSAFWWIPRESAYYATFTVLAIGGGAFILGITYWLQRNYEKIKIPKKTE